MHGKGQIWFKNGSYADGIWDRGFLIEADLRVVNDNGSVDEMKANF
jgi:hypothetical protein